MKYGALQEVTQKPLSEHSNALACGETGGGGLMGEAGEISGQLERKTSCSGTNAPFDLFRLAQGAIIATASAYSAQSPDSPWSWRTLSRVPSALVNGMRIADIKEHLENVCDDR